MNIFFDIKYNQQHLLGCNGTNSEFQYSKQFRKILRSEEMIKSKIMSYITQDFQSKSDLIVGGEEWQKVVLDMQSKFANAGAIRQTVSQVFNKDGIQRLGNLWEYTDEKAFVDCQLLFREAEQKFNKTEIPQKLFSNRGVILHDVYF